MLLAHEGAASMGLVDVGLKSVNLRLLFRDRYDLVFAFISIEIDRSISRRFKFNID